MTDEEQKKSDECSAKVNAILREYGMRLHVNFNVAVVPHVYEKVEEAPVSAVSEAVPE